jgi:CheY-like chemotaxis protein
MSRRRARAVLLVEASSLRRQLLTKELARRGYLVTASASASEALQLLVHTRTDLVLLGLDLSLPGAREQVQQFRTRSRTRELPVLLYSATLRRHLASLRGRSPEELAWLEEVVDLHAAPAAVDACLDQARAQAPAPLPGLPPDPGDQGSTRDPAEPGTDEELRALAARLARAPWDAATLAVYAARLYARSRFEELLEACDRLLALGHEPARHTLFQGDAFYQLGRVEAAILAWERSIALDPDDLLGGKARRRIEVALRHGGPGAGAPA